MVIITVWQLNSILHGHICQQLSVRQEIFILQMNHTYMQSIRPCNVCMRINISFLIEWRRKKINANYEKVLEKHWLIEYPISVSFPWIYLVPKRVMKQTKIKKKHTWSRLADVHVFDVKRIKLVWQKWVWVLRDARNNNNSKKKIH